MLYLCHVMMFMKAHVFYIVMIWNNMPPKRTSAAAAPMTAAVVEQLIKAGVFEALANHETLKNSTNGHGEGSRNSGIELPAPYF
ncbi:hypothetical protein Tco_0342944 [Tanacetum coccineum]